MSTLFQLLASLIGALVTCNETNQQILVVSKANAASLGRIEAFIGDPFDVPATPQLTTLANKLEGTATRLRAVSGSLQDVVQTNKP